VLSEWNTITQKLGEIARTRHAKFGNTIFHLEPNLKDCPGGLRDYHLAVWFALLFHLKETKEWPRQRGGVFQSARGDASQPSTFWRRRDVSFTSAMDETTIRSTGNLRTKRRLTRLPGNTRHRRSEYWMRTYYRHAASSIDERLCSWSTCRAGQLLSPVSAEAHADCRD